MAADFVYRAAWCHRQQDAGLQLSHASTRQFSFITENTELLSVGSAGHGDCCCYATVENLIEGQHLQTVEMVLTSLGALNAV